MTTTLPTLLAFLVLLPILYYFLTPTSLPGIPNATPNLPIIGNAIHFGLNPVNFLKTQRARHGDVFLVNLAIIKIIFFLGPEGTNAILKGTEKGGISFWDALKFVIGGAVNKGNPPPPLPPHPPPHHYTIPPKRSVSFSFNITSCIVAMFFFS